LCWPLEQTAVVKPGVFCSRLMRGAILMASGLVPTTARNFGMEEMADSDS
jgi:hypothetical protein